MMQLNIYYSDGSHDTAYGGIDCLERAIDRAAVRITELQATITSWTVTDVAR